MTTSNTAQTFDQLCQLSSHMKILHWRFSPLVFIEDSPKVFWVLLILLGCYLQRLFAESANIAADNLVSHSPQETDSVRRSSPGRLIQRNDDQSSRSEAGVAMIAWQSDDSYELINHAQSSAMSLMKLRLSSSNLAVRVSLSLNSSNLSIWIISSFSRQTVLYLRDRSL